MHASLDEITRISDIPRYWAQAAPDAPALFEQGAALSFAQLRESIQHACLLLEQHGVQEGDRVMLVSENCRAQIALLFAVGELNAWPVVVNARLSGREVEAIRAHCIPRLEIFTGGISPDARTHAEAYSAVEIDTALGPLWLSPSDPMAVPEHTKEARQVAALIYTSGTTGTPKGVMTSHHGLLHFARVSSTSRNMRPDDVAHGVLPISHIFGLGTVLLATMYAGASLYVEPRFSPEHTLHALSAHGISILQGVPMMFTRLLAKVKETGSRPHAPRLRYIYTGGAPLDQTLKREVEALFGLPLHHGYGMTEYAGSLFITRAERPRSDTSAGEIVAGAEVRIVDENGNDVPPGASGEIWARGPGTMLGYYKAPEATAAVLLRGGWLNTGDIGRRDSDGALFIVGRTKDLIIHSGFNVYPIEVESVINSFPGVRLSAVVGRETADHNEEVVAFVEARPGARLDMDGLRSYLKDALAPYKRPSKIIELAAIPTTASGKLLKRDLKRLAQDSSAAMPQSAACDERNPPMKDTQSAFGTVGPEETFFAALKSGVFRIQRCSACARHVFYPRVLCNHCGAPQLEWVDASGNGTVYSSTVVRRKAEAGGDLNIALIDLEEGVRMMSRVEGMAPDEVRIGMPVKADIVIERERPLVVFRKQGGAS
jgi:long-chain acyl-CoA synthetase